MTTFAFIIHPPTLRHAARVLPVLKLMPRTLFKSFLKSMPPVFVSRMRHVRSRTGVEATGIMVACPLLPKQMLELPVDFVLDKIVAACRIGERMHAGIVGLGGYTSIVADKGYSIARRSNIPVTTGSSGTAWSACAAVHQLALRQGVEVRSAKLAVIGATGAIGSLVCRSLCREVASMTIVARHPEKLEALAATIRALSQIPVVIEFDARKAAADADLVVLTTSAPEALLKPGDFKSGSIVCDISVPTNIAGRFDARPDVVIVEAGRVRLPSQPGLSVDIATRPGVVYACMAETILLTLEGRFESFSLGDQIPLENVAVIGGLAEKHGFAVDLPDA